MSPRHFVVLALALLGALCAAPVPVAGTRVVLEPPPDFVKADQFAGFMQKATGASILVSELPAPFAQATKGFDAAGLATRGMTLVKKETVTLPFGEALLLSVTQKANGILFAKWMLAFGNAARTTLIVATYPEKSDAALGTSLRTAILGATLAEGASAPSAGVTFTVQEQPPLRFVQHLGNSFLFTTAEKFPAGALLFVGASVTEDLAIAQRRAHALRRLRQKNDHVEQIELIGEKPVEIDGLPGFTLTAHGRERKTGVKLFVLQTTLYNEEGYFVGQGLAPADLRADYEPLFNAVIATFRRKR